MEIQGGHRNEVTTIEFSPDGKHFISGDEDGIIKIWNVETRNCKTTLKAHDARINALAFSPDGKTFYSGADEHVIKIWNFTMRSCSG